MRWIYMLLLLISTIAISGESLEIELSSDNTISIDSFNSDGEVLFIYLPSERGFGNAHVSTTQQLAFIGTDVWVVDLHSSYMIPKSRSSIDKFDISDLVEMVNIAENMNYSKIYFLTAGRGAKLALRTAFKYQKKYPESNVISGHIFHSPHLISGAPALGEDAEYIESAKNSNLPIYMILPQNSTKFLRSEEISKVLKIGGSSVFTHLLKNASGGFERRTESSLSETDLIYKSDLAETYMRAVQLMSTVTAPNINKETKLAINNAKSALYEPKLVPFNGNPLSPKLDLLSMSGEAFSLDDYKGKVVLINFWASWCKPCVKEIPSLVRLKEERLSGKQFEILTVNIGEEKKVIEDFVKLIKFELPILLDTRGDAVKDWKVYAYPSNFIIDKQGKIRYAYRGALEWDADSIVKTFEGLL